MRPLFRLASMFFVLVAIGCSAAQPQRGPAITPNEAIGVWSLVDDENTTFDVRLAAGGAADAGPDGVVGGRARSNWSKGPLGAEGEAGRWQLDGDRIVIDYTDGWRDVIIRAPGGRFRKESFAPRAPRDAAPSNSGQAVRTPEAFARWVGVYEVPVAESRHGRSFHVSIQSSHAAWKSIDDLRVGSWWIVEGALRIRWANGWLDELRPVGTGFQVRSWKPGTTIDAVGNPSEPPTNTGGAFRLD